MYETYLIAYDIRNADRLRKLARIAQDYGLRIQKSIFEAELLPSELKDMESRMKKLIDPREDGIKIFHLCQSCEARRTGAGRGKPALPDAAWHVF
ncbi:CRISPR-associated endonuclease Cas2 [uncultured Mailhella sp.]|uniref:CRISPR-associated endonuclease Cas2 n=1 Tax=uncultured Mailhella sp. TaxID=1981031 RepID=UPI00261E3880|nr:CRISPR-associated endonuclease Cas2 [uncultured Mailhella sp.]